jgi:hypothetical protein
MMIDPLKPAAPQDRGQPQNHRSHRHQLRTQSLNCTFDHSLLAMGTPLTDRGSGLESLKHMKFDYLECRKKMKDPEELAAIDSLLVLTI